MEELPLELGCEIIRWLPLKDLVRFSRSSPVYREIVRSCLSVYDGDLRYPHLQALPGLSEVRGTVTVRGVQELGSVSRQLRGNFHVRMSRLRSQDLLPILQILEVRATLYPENETSIQGHRDLVSYSGVDTLFVYLETSLTAPIIPSLPTLEELTESLQSTKEDPVGIDHVLARLVRGRSRITLNLHNNDLPGLIPVTSSQIVSQKIVSTGISRHNLDLGLLNLQPSQLQELFGYSVNLRAAFMARPLYPWLAIKALVSSPRYNGSLSQVRRLHQIYVPLEFVNEALSIFQVDTLDIYILSRASDIREVDPGYLSSSDQRLLRLYQATYPQVTFRVYR